MWYDHQFFRLRDTFAKNRQAWQKCASFYVLRIYAGKSQKSGSVGTWGPGAPTFLQRAFFEIFFSKFVKREKLAHF